MKLLLSEDDCTPRISFQDSSKYFVSIGKVWTMLDRLGTMQFLLFYDFNVLHTIANGKSVVVPASSNQIIDLASQCCNWEKAAISSK